jgi:hypothetical protein
MRPARSPVLEMWKRSGAPPHPGSSRSSAAGWAQYLVASEHLPPARDALESRSAGWPVVYPCRRGGRGARSWWQDVSPTHRSYRVGVQPRNTASWSQVLG